MYRIALAHLPVPATAAASVTLACDAVAVYFASVNYAIPGAPTSAIVVSPDATVLAEKTERRAATGLLAARCKY